jgi:cytochrome oxidase Cu insertion factor (SCO1/SenC/PrrC family)
MGRGLWLALLVAAAGAARAEEPALFEPPAPGSYELPPIRRVAEHWLVDDAGAAAPVLGIGADEVAVVAFVYSRCGDACPLALATLQRLDRDLAARPAVAARTRLVTVSFDPMHDTPERMAELRAHLAPRGRWAFLTAPDTEALSPVLADFGQRVERDDAERLLHVLKVFLVDGRGDVRNVYSTGLLDPRLVAADIETLLGAGRVERELAGEARDEAP